MSAKVPVFGNQDDIWLSRGKPHPFTGRSMIKKRRVQWWEVRGQGPDGMRCRECNHLRANVRSKTYYKCGLMKITHGRGTDIGVLDKACSKFELDKEEK